LVLESKEYESSIFKSVYRHLKDQTYLRGGTTQDIEDHWSSYKSSGLIKMGFPHKIEQINPPELCLDIPTDMPAERMAFTLDDTFRKRHTVFIYVFMGGGNNYIHNKFLLKTMISDLCTLFEERTISLYDYTQETPPIIGTLLVENYTGRELQSFNDIEKERYRAVVSFDLIHDHPINE